MFGVQPLAELFGDFLIVEVGEREMRVAFDTDVGQHHELSIAAVTVDCIYLNRAISTRTRHWSALGIGEGLCGMLSP